MKKVLITGAAGSIGKVLRAELKKHGYFLRLCDIAPLGVAEENEELVQVDIHDLSQVKEAMQGMDCIVHLAGIAHEDIWERILPTNIVGTYNIFEAARQAGVPRVIFASSNHAVGFYPSEITIDTEVLPRPDSLYGVSKVFGESLGRYYADKYGLSVACLRVGSFEQRPSETRHLRTWLSHRDCVQLVHRCIDTPDYHFLIAYGVSANKRRKWQDNAADIIGYHPEDNAEMFVGDSLHEESDPIAKQFHGGAFCSDRLK